MYKGNMGDFIEKLATYVKDKYNIRIKLDKYFDLIVHDYGDKKVIKAKEREGVYILFVESNNNSRVYNSRVYNGERVYDSHDFEDQVFDIINKRISEDFVGTYQKEEFKKIT